MAFSKGKRIEDETSKRIVDLAVNIGCNEGPDALTVTRICKELNCDRRVVYNRFRDVDELNMIVADKCSEELISNAKKKINEDAAYCDKLTIFIEAIFTYIHQKNAYFQYYTSLYEIVDSRIKNNVLQELTSFIEKGKKIEVFMSDINSETAAKNIWFIITGASSILAENPNYKYDDSLKTVLFGTKAIIQMIKK